MVPQHSQRPEPPTTKLPSLDMLKAPGGAQKKGMDSGRQQPKPEEKKAPTPPPKPVQNL